MLTVVSIPVMDSPVDEKELTRLFEKHLAILQTRYAEALRAAGWDSVLIHSGTPKPRSAFDDQFFPLRPTPFFLHWAPLTRAECGVLVAPGKKPTLYLNAERNFWEAHAEPETGHFWSSFEVVEVDPPEQVRELRPQGKVALISEDAPRAASWGFDEASRNPAALMKALDHARTRKTPYELFCLREANRRASIGHRACMEAFEKGDASELDLHLLFLARTQQDDQDTPYKNIVAENEHAATLHHVTYSREQFGAQALLVDAGARYQGYESDVTRTTVKGKGAAVDAFRALIGKVNALQQEMCRRVKVGIPYERLHNESHDLLAKALVEMKLVDATEDELVASGLTRKFLPHGLGHSLGIQTHDVGCAVAVPESRNPWLRNTSVVEAGQVFTIEPGCYFIGALMEELKPTPIGKKVDWKLVTELSKFGGIRIEDDLVVGEGRVDNLTRAFLP